VFVNFDRDMRCPKTKEWARCRNSNLNEDLGKVGGWAGWLVWVWVGVWMRLPLQLCWMPSWMLLA
jgi:hypothetical protein